MGRDVLSAESLHIKN